MPGSRGTSRLPTRTRSRASARSPRWRASSRRSSPPTRSAGSCIARSRRDPRCSSTSRVAGTRISRPCAPASARWTLHVADLEAALRARRDAGGKAFVPYVTGGTPGFDGGLLRAFADAGADAIAVGIPFSDPVIDGPVVQEASRRALETGATPMKVLETIREASVGVPIAMMTYFNPIFRRGLDRFASEAAESGVSGAIVPDLPVDEADGWIRACVAAHLSPVFLAAPGSAKERLEAIAGPARGFVYCVSTFGVTGEREAL